jgi:hypothetical protein
LREEVRDYGKIPNTPDASQELIVKLAPERRELRFCYEAGPAATASTYYRGQARMCGVRSIVDPAEAGRLTVGMRTTLPSCIWPVN